MVARRSRTAWPFLIVLLIVSIAARSPVSVAVQPAQSSDAQAVTYAETPLTPESVAPPPLATAETPTDIPMPPMELQPTESSATPIEATSKQSTSTASSFAALKPNEMGKIMVLEYHVIGDEEDRWTRSRENFRKDLEYLYNHSYHLIGLNQLLDNRIDVPAGKTPVVLTFDDSNRSQFQVTLQADETLKVDPASGLGILEEFIAEHPDFGRAAVFCVLPGADPPNDLWGQPELRQQKLRYLAQNGYEICNHTLWHGNLGEETHEEASEYIARAQKIVQDAVPGYRINTFDPPHGVYADDINIMTDGAFEGTTYRHLAILEVGGGPMTAPNDANTDWLHTRRMQAIPEVLDEYLTYFEQHPEERYVSDGNPDRVVFPVGRMRDYAPTKGAREVESTDPNYVVIKLR